jgi:hypothetical protein
MVSDSNRENWRQRKLLFRQAMDDKQLLYTTYNRYYQAHHITTWAGWIATGLTAIIGSVLLYVITSKTFGIPLIGNALQGTSDVLAILLLIISLLNAFYSPEARSVRYYRAGQDLQELYDEYENFVNLEIANSNCNVDELKEEFYQLHKRRHSLNKSVPQLSGLWYSIIQRSQQGYRTFIPLVPSKQEFTVSSWIKSKLGRNESNDNSNSNTKAKWNETLEEKMNGLEQSD